MARVETSVEEVTLFGGVEETEGAYGYTAEHAKWVNWDTTYSSPPPFDPIFEWVERKWNDLDEGLKLAALDEDTSTAQERASQITRDEWKREVTFLIMFAIESSGIEGIHFMERSGKRARDDADAIAQVYEDTDDPDAAFKIVRDWVDFAFGISQDIIADEATDRGTLLQSGYVDVDGSEEFEDGGG
jgi:hypothetical protein